MLDIGKTKLTLELPYVEHLTLRNCWFSPHVLTSFGRDTKHLLHLKKLTLESVSISAPANPNGPPGTQLPIPGQENHQAFHFLPESQQNPIAVPLQQFPQNQHHIHNLNNSFPSDPQLHPQAW